MPPTSLKLRCQKGFTTVTLMGVLGVGGVLVAAGFAAVDVDISLSREDQDYKQAHGAAEAGLQWYLNRPAPGQQLLRALHEGGAGPEWHFGAGPRQPEVERNGRLGPALVAQASGQH